METLGDRIRFIRSVILKISQAELAILMGLKTKVGVSSWELNKAEPCIEQIIKLSEMSGMSIEWILTGKERNEQIQCTAKEKKLEAENKQLKMKLASLLRAFENLNKVKREVTEDP